MAEDRHIAVGFELRPGITTIAYDTERDLVLCVVQGSFDPYVSWKYKWDDERLVYDTWSGHYSRTIEDMAQDWATRP